ncbi:alkaline phosphatase [Chlorobium phaeovibrioides]|uniref:alkaline phosphatase n=1 Tax=Chlorobium phaeovibrioides TaxID=1094 RepID=UPI001CB8AC5A|nr:alkaline phosphatase [Chlorobium phaeovibrioides]
MTQRLLPDAYLFWSAASTSHSSIPFMPKPFSGLPSFLFVLKRMLTLVLLITSIGCSSEVSLNGGGQRFASQADSGARYVFLFIGDGMGLAQVELGRALLAPGDSLSFLSFPVTGMISTSAADRYITDSAAAGTALATGYATSVGTVSMAANHRDTLKTIVEMAEGDGRRTGVVSSVGIDNATPACFYAHEPLRGSLYAIALQMAASGVDYFGGGRPEGNFPHKRSRAVVDRGDIDSLMQLSGYSVVKNSASLKAVMPGTPCIASAPSDMFGALPFDMDRPARDADLALFTREGIRLLDNPKGFFMMVEGGKIDWACHANDAAAAGRDVAAFDRAIREAVAFYHRHPEETLIVVTADHECGGLSLGNRDGAYDSRLELLHYQTISMENLSGKVAAWKKAGGVSFLAALDSVRVFAGLGAGADSELLLSRDEERELRDAFRATMSAGAARGGQYGAADSFSPAVVGILNRRAGVGWTSNVHTAVPVPVFALGHNAHMFAGFYPNTALARRLMQASGLPGSLR